LIIAEAIRVFRRLAPNYRPVGPTPIKGVFLVSNVLAAHIESTTEFLEQKRERIPYTKKGQPSEDSLIIPEGDIRRYEEPREDTVFPLEYAFYLLGGVEDRTVIDLGCGDGVNTVILASLGARVLSVDISKESLDLTGRRAAANRVDSRVTLLHSDATAIPIEAAAVDAIICTALLHQVDPIQTARQIRRVLKPGGVAVFDEAITGPTPFGAIKHLFPTPEEADSLPGYAPLNIPKVDAVCRAVGKRGRRREFWLTARFISRMGARTFSSATKAAQRLDAAVLQRFPFARKLASPVVWEARKEC
jgi:SAM-dependent methyltransferase